MDNPHTMSEIKTMEMPAIPIHLWAYHKEVKVALLDKDAIPPERNHWQDAGLDFFSLGDVVIPPYSAKNVRTGITMEIPFGFFALLKEKGRSDFLIGAGVIDEGYQGEIIFKVFNPTNDVVTFLRGQPIGQMIFIPVIRPDVAIFDIKELHKQETERGNAGGILEEL